MNKKNHTTSLPISQFQLHCDYYLLNNFILQDGPSCKGLLCVAQRKYLFLDCVKLNRSPSKVCVIGNGYVGLPLCVLMKNCGHSVIGLDANTKAVASNRQGKSTIDDVEDHQLEGIWFTANPTETEDCDVYVICVPTHVTENKMADLKYVLAVKETLLVHAKPGALIILESTVGVGDTRRTFKDMVAQGYRVANSPKRIDPGRKGCWWCQR